MDEPGESSRVGGRRSRDITSRSRSPGQHGRQRRRSRSPRGEREGRSHHHRKRYDDDEGHHDDGHRHHHRRHHRHESPRDRGDTRHSSHRHKRHRSKERRSHAPPAHKELPYNARALVKSDQVAFRPLLAYYLDLQKGKILFDMDEREIRGRWKSFMSKWNRGELSEGWYDPEMYLTAQEREKELREEYGDPDAARGVMSPDGDENGRSRSRSLGRGNGEEHTGYGRGDRSGKDDEDDDDDDDDVGPSLPPPARPGAANSGPRIPNLDDLASRRETLAEEARLDRSQAASDLRYERKQDRKLQKERLEELVPRAAPGSRERMLEKKAAVNEKMRSFRDKSPGGEVAEGELMGGGDGVADFKRQKAEEERKKTEREVRREEIARAKAEEREERVREWKEREEGTMKALKELAKQRFG